MGDKDEEEEEDEEDKKEDEEDEDEKEKKEEEEEEKKEKEEEEEDEEEDDDKEKKKKKLVSSWRVVRPKTTIKVRDGYSLHITLRLDLGKNVWIVGLKDGKTLITIMIKILGVNKYAFLGGRYTSDFKKACANPGTFTKACFTGKKFSKNKFKLAL